MIEHDGDRRCRDQIPDGGNHGEAGEHLDVPVAAPDAIDRGRNALAPDIGIADPAGRQIEADAADARFVHGVEIALQRLVVDHGDAARIRAARLDAEQRSGVVGAIDARRHDHHALDMQRPVQRRHFFRRCWFRRIDTPREERKFLRVAVDVGMAIAGVSRNVEIHRRRGLRGPGESIAAGHGNPGGDRGTKDTASGEHPLTPWIPFSRFWHPI